MGNIIAFLLLLWVHLLFLKIFLGIFIPPLRQTSLSTVFFGLFKLIGGSIIFFLQFFTAIIKAFFVCLWGLITVIGKMIMLLLKIIQLLPSMISALFKVCIYTVVFLWRALITRK